MGLFPETRFDDWTRRDVGSFAKRYWEPLWRVALLDFAGLDPAAAQDLAQSFLVRELERDERVFDRFDGKAHDARFRTYLRACFWRFCRDELEKSGRRAAAPLVVEPPAAGSSDLDRLVVRDLLRRLRERVVAGDGKPLEPDAVRYFDLKWPTDLQAAPRTDAEVGAALGLPRGQLRTLKRKVADRVVLALRRQLHDEGLSPAAIDAALAAYVGALGRDEPQPA